MQPRLKDEHRMAESGLEMLQDARAVVHIIALPIEQERLAALTSGLKARGLIPWVEKSFVTNGPISTSTEALLKRIETSREAIASEYSGLPVVLLGLDYGAMIAASLAHRLPGQYRAVGFCGTPNLSAAKRALLLALLYWERFRLGSDVPSQVLRRSGEAPMPIGLAIAALRPGRCAKAFSDSGSTSYVAKRTLSMSNLNQNLSEEIADWIQSMLADRSDDQVA